MTRRPERPEADDRNARRAAALRANLQRRKAQARSRTGETTDDNNEPPAGIERPDRADESEG
ncbi:hypothetical protein KTN05_06815 [Paracoccus sp. Z118]|uniref:hypothetical protein n=1 Tax=Paracoccus sp. Z118 TaxID=2851017 RepID=UPI001C2C37D3|nr:hypothetical protein [Paracoccus sp. Z118]MBV0891565.1 hypothetical protein [Paracoccus sp. Z118]